MGNNAFLNNGAFIAPHKGMCGHFASLGKSGDILLEDTTFRGKPRNGVTVALWVNLARTSRGIHSLFSTARVMTIGQIMGKAECVSIEEITLCRLVYSLLADAFHTRLFHIPSYFRRCLKTLQRKVFFDFAIGIIQS